MVYLTDEQGGELVPFLDVRRQDVGFDDSMFPNEAGLVSVAFNPNATPETIGSIRRGRKLTKGHTGRGQSVPSLPAGET